MKYIDSSEWHEHNDAWKKDHYRFCAKCGGKMVEVSDLKQSPCGFDRGTGEPRFRFDKSRVWACELFTPESEDHDVVPLALGGDVSHLCPVPECLTGQHAWKTCDGWGREPIKYRHCLICARPEKKEGIFWRLDEAQVRSCKECGSRWFNGWREGSSTCETRCYKCGEWYGASSMGYPVGTTPRPSLPPIVGVPRS